MSNVVEIVLSETQSKLFDAKMNDGPMVRRLCEPHFAEGNDVRFVDANGHPVLDVTRDGGWVKEHEPPPPPSPAESVEGAVLEAVPSADIALGDTVVMPAMGASAEAASEPVVSSSDSAEAASQGEPPAEPAADPSPPASSAGASHDEEFDVPPDGILR